MGNPTTIANNVIDTLSMNVDQILPQISREVRNRDANIAPYTHLSRMMNKMAIKGTETIWWETQQLPQWTKINNGAGYLSTATDIVIDDPSYFAKADMIICPRTGETMRVTAVVVGTSTITVTRSMGATAAAALVDDDDLFRIGCAFEEHSLKGVAIMVKPVKRTAHLQIWRIPVEESETSAYTEKWTGDERARQRLEKRDLLMLELEKANIFGEDSETVGPDGKPLRTAGGFVEVVRVTSLHNVAPSGSTTEAVLRKELVDAWDYSTSGELYFYIPNWFCDRIDSFGVNRLQVLQGDETYGVAIRRWKSSLGELRLINHKLLRGAVYGGYGLIADMSNIRYVSQAGQDTRLVMGIQENDRHGYVDEWRNTSGTRVEIPESHQLIVGLTL